MSEPRSLRPSRESGSARVDAMCSFLEAGDTPPTLEEVATHVGLSPFHAHRTFKAATGVTPRAYAAFHRAERLRGSLASAPTVTQAMVDSGFRSSGRFYEAADAMLGMTPKRYRAGGASLRIRFAVGPCSLGEVLAAATDVGVCAVLLGDDADALVGDLHRRFPRAELVGADTEFEDWMARVVGVVDGTRSAHDLPLDLQGTAFQVRVWEALRRVPAGSRCSYAEVASALGIPSGARAVASACAANPVAVAIPCHRVVRTDGGLSGYRWGIARKRQLLEREAVVRR